MCGRTALTATPEDLREALGLHEVPSLMAQYNVPPSQPVAVLRGRSGSPERRLDLLRWGLLPRWAENAKTAHRLALARVESIAKARAFSDAVRKRRCLVIVDGFFEWRRDGKRASQPFFLRRPDKGPFGLAGIWERCVSRDGEVIESCAIITQPSRPPVNSIHDRMPLVLEREVWDHWLDPKPIDDVRLESLLEPRSPALIGFPVGTHVNDPRHDDARCIEPMEPAQLSLLAR